jgi:predicted SAM-dependent methyltransferase
MSRLNLGCGNLRLEGYKNIDKSPTAKADEFYDLTDGIKEKDGSIDEINAGCVLEQLTHEQFKFVLNECWRVLQEGGTLKGYVPSTDPRVLHLDPDDKLFFQIETFDYFNKNRHQWQEFGRNYGYHGWNFTEAHVNSSGILIFSMGK